MPRLTSSGDGACELGSPVAACHALVPSRPLKPVSPGVVGGLEPPTAYGIVMSEGSGAATCKTLEVCVAPHPATSPATTIRATCRGGRRSLTTLRPGCVAPIPPPITCAHERTSIERYSQ